MWPFTQAQWMGWAPSSLLLGWSIGPLLSIMNLRIVMWPPKHAQWAGVCPFSSRMLNTSGPSSAMVCTGTRSLESQFEIKNDSFMHKGGSFSKSRFFDQLHFSQTFVKSGVDQKPLAWDMQRGMLKISPTCNVMVIQCDFLYTAHWRVLFMQ